MRQGSLSTLKSQTSMAPATIIGRQSVLPNPTSTSCYVFGNLWGSERTVILSSHSVIFHDKYALFCCSAERSARFPSRNSARSQLLTSYSGQCSKNPRCLSYLRSLTTVFAGRNQSSTSVKGKQASEAPGRDAGLADS